MIAEVGQLALILALLLAVRLAVVGLIGVRVHRGASLVVQVRRLAIGQGFFVLLAGACLAAAFVTSDFSVRNVAENSNTMLPTLYRFAASWGSHEGSMLLWLLLQSAWMLAVVGFDRHLPPAVVGRVLGVLGLLSAAFLLFVLTTSNPFLRVFPIPLQGRDLNPLLQDAGMVFHPPLLYMGYVGFSVAFAFAIAALLDGRNDAAWARWSRRWTAFAWCFLTLGVMLGSWWAYRELGWGGWWFWDPVENAALMPWLAGTALVHALALSARRDVCHAWTLLLALVCFSLSLIGMFLVRSGVLTSVHAFALDPKRGLFILGFLLLVSGGSLALFALRAPRMRAAAMAGAGPGDGAHPAARLRERTQFAPLSRETFLLANTLLLSVAAASVLLGTLYPLLFEALGLGRISVGAPYFDTVFMPLMAPVAFLIGLGPLVRWQHASLADLWALSWRALAVAALAGVGLPLAFDRWSPLVALWLFLALWSALATLMVVRGRLAGARASARREPTRPLLANWGMVCAHLGVAVFIAAVTLVRAYQSEVEVRMAPGDSVAVGGFALRFEGVRQEPGPNYEAERGVFEVSRQGRWLRTLNPEKRRYASLPSTPMTEAAIDSRWNGDLYVVLGESGDAGSWTVRVQHKPFIGWIWAGCALMAFGGLLAGRGRRAAAGIALTWDKVRRLSAGRRAGPTRESRTIPAAPFRPLSPDVAARSSDASL